jgi:hypothetical protein
MEKGSTRRGMKWPAARATEQRRINPASPVDGALFHSPATLSPGSLVWGEKP